MVDLDRVRAVLAEAVAKRVTPGAQLAISWRTEGAWSTASLAIGTREYGRPDAQVNDADLYDLASLTKPMVATAFARRAARDGWSLAATLGSIGCVSRDAPTAALTLEQLATHRSGLPSWMPFYREIARDEIGTPAGRARVIAAASSTAPTTGPGEARYSDVGYILLGHAFETIAGAPLDALVREELPVAPPGDEVVYRPGASCALVPTEVCAWRNGLVRGAVHDENAYAMGGVAGHAGLFGNARRVATIGTAFVNALAGRSEWLDCNVARAMIAARTGGTHRFGWDGKSSERSSAGTKMSASTFGHLGFAGTSLWCDPANAIVVALLTNRVHPTRANDGIKALRPRVHDAVFEAVTAARMD